MRFLSGTTWTWPEGVTLSQLSRLQGGRCLQYTHIYPIITINLSLVDPDPHPDPDHCVNCTRIRIRIKVICWIRNQIRIYINLQMTSQHVWIMNLFEHCLKGLSLYLEARIWIRIRIRVKVGSGSASNKNHNPDTHQGNKSNPDPHQVMRIHNTDKST